MSNTFADTQNGNSRSNASDPNRSIGDTTLTNQLGQTTLDFILDAQSTSSATAAQRPKTPTTIVTPATPLDEDQPPVALSPAVTGDVAAAGQPPAKGNNNNGHGDQADGNAVVLGTTASSRRPEQPPPLPPKQAPVQSPPVAVQRPLHPFADSIIELDESDDESDMIETSFIEISSDGSYFRLLFRMIWFRLCAMMRVIDFVLLDGN